MITAQEKAQWLEALRSGKFQQRKYTLGYNNTYCCLGVYCVLNNIPFTESNDPDGDWDCDSNGLIYTTLKSKIPISELIRMNDNGATFAEIADWIEENIVAK